MSNKESATLVEQELCTFPDDDRDYCKVFSVPTEWLLDLLEKMDTFNERKGVDLQNFLDNYCWDETWFVYLQAKAEGKLLSESEEE